MARGGNAPAHFLIPPPSSLPPTDPDLAAVFSAWPNLLKPVRAGILAMVKAVR